MARKGFNKKDFYKIDEHPWLGFKLRFGSGFQVLDRQVVAAPPIITFYEEKYSEFFNFIKKIENCAENGKVLIDLRNVREVKAAAILVLFATVETLQKKYGRKNIVKFTKGRHPAITKAFGRWGFWELTAQSNTLPSPKLGKGLPICMTSYESTKRNDKSQLKKVIMYTQDAIAGAGLDEENVLAYNAITESVSNVWQHAYDEDFLGSEFNRDLANWWIIVERIDDQFFIAVFDIGVGIPATLERKPWYKVYFLNSDGQLYEYAADAHRIKMAVEYGRSRFKMDNRGKGLSEAKDFVLSNPEGVMIIYSGGGAYIFKTATGEEKLESIPSGFPGTLIQWNLRLETKK
ncbi:hypothetical protein QCD61_04960 [Pseudomonas viciae]|uniref:ATP-binding protein n=1 Tax=Pseudomonas viciae TaxID=2505979 RepID=A0ABY8PGS9_9PSED|nr:hypothetical protein [Pseudomonas viciae]WGO94435.1 hypothetical protein QCD61_04960 [Pseudomonas viciae]